MKNQKKEKKKERQGATLACGARPHFDPEMNLQENHKSISILHEEQIMFFSIVIQNS